MSVADCVILALVAVAFVAVVLRVRKRGVCADCSSSDSCSGSCPSCSTEHHGACPACEGVDQTAEKLGRGLK